MANKAIFFDRDGTLNIDIHYLHRPEDFIWVEGAKGAIKYANDNGYLAIIITNQSGVARGYYAETDIIKVYDWMNAELEKIDAHLDGIYYCPHHIDGKIPVYTKECKCRKPLPYMVNKACEDFQIDKSQSYFIGDTDGDMKCAQNAGVTGIKYVGGSLLSMLQNNIK